MVVPCKTLLDYLYNETNNGQTVVLFGERRLSVTSHACKGSCVTMYLTRMKGLSGKYLFI